MFDLFNFNIGGSRDNPYGESSGSIRGGRVEGVTEVRPPRPHASAYAKMAKALIKVLNVASIDFYELSEDIWDNTDDAQKIHFYRLVDGLVDRALIHHDDGTAFTLVEKAIGERADLIRETVYKNG